jgi:hypothetical protein
MANLVTFQFTHPIILVYPNLFTPRKYKNEQGIESGEPKYDFRAVMAPDHPDVPALRSHMATAAENAGINIKEPIDWCLRSGDKLADKAQAKGKANEVFRGQLVLVSRGQFAPGLSVVLPGRGIVDIPMSGNERLAAEKYFYGGVKVLVQVQLVGYHVGNNTPVVTAYPNLVLSLNEGDHIAAFGGATSRSGASAFASYTGHVSSVDPHGINSLV